MMKVYLPAGNDVEDLINILQEVTPNLIKSRLVLEITTEDKATAVFLKSLAAQFDGDRKEIKTDMKVRKERKKSTSKSGYVGSGSMAITEARENLGMGDGGNKEV
jgi:hypothetical protein